LPVALWETRERNAPFLRKQSAEVDDAMRIPDLATAKRVPHPPNPPESVLTALIYLKPCTG
jgi:hypothetical protein